MLFQNQTRWSFQTNKGGMGIVSAFYFWYFRWALVIDWDTDHLT